MKEAMKVLFWIYILHCSCYVTPSSSEHRKRRSAKDEFYHHEVVKPKLFNDGKLISTTQIRGGHLEKFQLIIPTNGETISVELKLNRHLFSGLYIEKYHAPKGEVLVQPTDHNTTGHCYYHGNVKGHISSIAAISTCDGLSGMIVGEHDVFHIVPEQPAVITGPHLLFRGSHQKITNHSCGTEDHQFLPDVSSLMIPKHRNRLKREVFWPYDSNLDTKIVELYVVNDNLQYTNYDSDPAKVIARTKDIINVASSLYKKVNTHLALVGVEIWTEKDPIGIVENADTTMNNFLAYRRLHISPKHKNDNAQLITGHTFGQGVIGKAPINTICSWQYSGGVNMDHSLLVGPVATTVAHEMGHNFGLAHDIDECSCPHEKCIMNSNSGGTRPTHWSSCSMEQFADAFHLGMDYCLHDIPEALYQSPVCGNGFLEAGEQCDCGTVESCDSKCCNATTCTTFPNASCATGKCCDLNTCQLLSASTPCRESADTCDLAEYCHGDSEHCPSDAYKKDGTTCSVTETESYCYQGHCRSRESQCQKLWGVTGHDSIAECYAHFNVIGTANGHCGFNWIDKSFQKCASEDSKCGMLHCRHMNEKLMFWKEALSFTMPKGYVVVDGVREDCFGAILDVGLDYEDPGMVPQGAKCGDNKLCVDQECRSIDSLALKSCPDCNGNGVCNNLGECHCEVGYAPPDCKYAGNGGSGHSGPIKILGTNVALVIGMVIFFLVCVPLIILLIFCVYRHREEIKQQWPVHSTFSKKYRSICREPTPQFDTTRQNPHPPIHKPSRPAPSIPRASSFNKSRPTAVAANGVKRTPSFRPEDITQVKLESTTNKQVDQLDDLPVHCRSPTLDAVRVASMGHRFDGHDFTKKPPSSVVTSCGVGAHGDQGGVSPARPPPPLPKYNQNFKPAGFSPPEYAEEDDTVSYANVKNTQQWDSSPPPPYSPPDSSNEPLPVLPPRPAHLGKGGGPTSSSSRLPSGRSTTNNHNKGNYHNSGGEIPPPVKKPQQTARGGGGTTVANARMKFEADDTKDRKTQKTPVERVPSSSSSSSSGIKPPPPAKPALAKRPSGGGTTASDSRSVAKTSQQGPTMGGFRKPQLKPKPSLKLESQDSVDC